MSMPATAAIINRSIGLNFFQIATKLTANITILTQSTNVSLLRNISAAAPIIPVITGLIHERALLTM